MKEYIDRNAVVAQITKLINVSGKYTDYECGADDACFVVAHAPAADVRPVVKAAWEDTPNPQWPAHSIRHCPCCGWSIPKSKLRAKDSSWNYCPNCGTDMRATE